MANQPIVFLNSAFSHTYQILINNKNVNSPHNIVEILYFLIY